MLDAAAISAISVGGGWLVNSAEILEMLPPSVKGIFFRPEVATEIAEPSWPILREWSALPDLLQ